jgi:hypothetical protein
MAELWTISRKRTMTPEEQQELEQCLHVNAKLCWDMAHLENASLLASMTRDVDWQHDICRQIEAFPWQPNKPDTQDPV